MLNAEDFDAVSTSLFMIVETCLLQVGLGLTNGAQFVMWAVGTLCAMTTLKWFKKEDNIKNRRRENGKVRK